MQIFHHGRYDILVPSVSSCIHSNRNHNWLGTDRVTGVKKVFSNKELTVSFPWPTGCNDSFYHTYPYTLCKDPMITDVSKCFNITCVKTLDKRYSDITFSGVSRVISGMILNGKNFSNNETTLVFTDFLSNWKILENNISDSIITLVDISVTVLDISVNGETVHPSKPAATIFELSGSSTINVVSGTFSNNSNVNFIKYVNVATTPGLPHQVNIKGMTFSNNENTSTSYSIVSDTSCINDRTLVELDGSINATFTDCSWISNTNLHAITAQNGTSITMSRCDFSGGNNNGLNTNAGGGFGNATDILYKGTSVQRQVGAMRGAAVYAHNIKSLQVGNSHFTNISGGSGVAIHVNDASEVILSQAYFSSNTTYWGSNSLLTKDTTGHQFGTGVVVLSNVDYFEGFEMQFGTNKTAKWVRAATLLDKGGASALLIHNSTKQTNGIVKFLNSNFWDNHGTTYNTRPSSETRTTKDYLVGGAALQFGYNPSNLYALDLSITLGELSGGLVSRGDWSPINFGSPWYPHQHPSPNYNTGGLSSSIYANLSGGSIKMVNTTVWQASDVYTSISNHITSIDASKNVANQQYWMVDGSADYAVSDIRIEGNGTVDISGLNTWKIDTSLSSYNYNYFMVLNSNTLKLNMDSHISILPPGIDICGGDHKTWQSGNSGKTYKLILADKSNTKFIKDGSVISTDGSSILSIDNSAQIQDIASSKDVSGWFYNSEFDPYQLGSDMSARADGILGQYECPWFLNNYLPVSPLCCSGVGKYFREECNTASESECYKKPENPKLYGPMPYFPAGTYIECKWDTNKCSSLLDGSHPPCIYNKYGVVPTPAPGPLPPLPPSPTDLWKCGTRNNNWQCVQDRLGKKTQNECQTLAGCGIPPPSAPKCKSSILSGHEGVPTGWSWSDWCKNGQTNNSSGCQTGDAQLKIRQSSCSKVIQPYIINAGGKRKMWPIALDGGGDACTSLLGLDISVKDPYTGISMPVPCIQDPGTIYCKAQDLSNYCDDRARGE